MHRLAFVLLAVATFCEVASPCTDIQRTQAKANGRCWHVLSEFAKATYVAGVEDALREADVNVHGF